MKHQILILFFLSLSLRVFTQDEYKPANYISDNEVTTIAYWMQGESVTYDVQKEETKTRGDKKKKELSKEFKDYSITLSVLDSLEHSYLIEAFYSNIVPDANLSVDEKKMLKMYENIPILYRIDEFGKIDSIVNSKDLLKHTEKIFDKIVEESDDDNPFLRAMLNSSLEKLNNQDNMMAMYGEDIIRIHSIMGAQLIRDKKETYEIQYVTFNNFKLEGNAQIELKKVDLKKNMFEVKVEMEPNDDQLELYVQDFVGSVVLGLPFEFKREEFSISMITRSNYNYDLNTGWPKVINAINTVELEDGKEKVDIESKYIFTLSE